MTQSPYRWVIVAAGGFLGCVAIGAMFCLPVFLVPLTAATGWSRTGVSSAMTIGFLTMAASGIAWGLVVDRIGPRTVVLIGVILLGLAWRCQAAPRASLSSNSASARWSASRSRQSCRP
jgi:MFS family permease